MISCPAEVTLVRMSNDSTLPAEKRRNYSGVGNAFQRILKEEGAATFFRGCGPFVNRAMLVGECDVILFCLCLFIVCILLVVVCFIVRNSQ